MIPGVLSSVVGHLWQFTLFAALVWIAALVLRRHDARVRYWLWVAASVKFLVPFSWLISGLQFDRRPPASAAVHKRLLIAAALAVITGPTVAVVIAALGQSPKSNPAPGPQFEAASIRRSAGDTSGVTFAVRGNRLHAVSNPVMNLIQNAYDLPIYRIAGAPGWVNSARYDIEATAGGAATEPQLMLMLRTLLADRFKLQAHREQREGPVYVLRVASGGHKMRVSREGDESNNKIPNRGRNTWRLTHVDMAVVASELGRRLRRPVVDKTGLTGYFDIFVGDLPPLQPEVQAGGDAALSDTPSVFTVVREELGLVLEPGRGPVDTLVIDRIERPADN